MLVPIQGRLRWASCMEELPFYRTYGPSGAKIAFPRLGSLLTLVIIKRKTNSFDRNILQPCEVHVLMRFTNKPWLP